MGLASSSDISKAENYNINGLTGVQHMPLAAVTDICNTEKIKFKSSLSFVIPIITTILRDVSSINLVNNAKSKEIILVLTEIIVNSIKHGNKNNYNKNITITYAYDATSITFSVEDEGNGFDYRRSMLDKRSPGINLVTTICDDVYWNRKGNKIVVVMSLL